MSSLRRRSFAHDDRGQALYETALFLPVMILALFGIIWATKEATLSERIQLGVRYGGTISQLQNPYNQYSMYALYATIDGKPPTDLTTCASAPPAIVSQGDEAFWQARATPVSNCFPGAAIVNSPETYSQPIFVQSSLEQVTGAAQTSGFLIANVFGGTSKTLVAQENFFRSPDVSDLAACTTVGSAVKLTFEAQTDSVTPTVAPTPVPATIPATSVYNLPLSCKLFSPPPSAPPATAPPTTPPTATPTPTPPPTPTPTPSPVPTASPKPTATPVPTATPKPTPSPTPTQKPTATPVPTATPKPTASPTPTQKPTASPTPTPSPKPTATPVPTPSPTPTVKPTPTPTPTATPPPGGAF
jgi:hypothetical protein